jgi:hypothetical protein
MRRPHVEVQAVLGHRPVPVSGIIRARTSIAPAAAQAEFERSRTPVHGGVSIGGRKRRAPVDAHGTCLNACTRSTSGPRTLPCWSSRPRQVPPRITGVVSAPPPRARRAETFADRSSPISTSAAPDLTLETLRVSAPHVRLEHDASLLVDERLSNFSPVLRPRSRLDRHEPHAQRSHDGKHRFALSWFDADRDHRKPRPSQLSSTSCGKLSRPAHRAQKATSTTFPRKSAS